MSIHEFFADALTGLHVFILPPRQCGVPFCMPCVFTPVGIEKAHRNLTGFEQGFEDLRILYPYIELLRGQVNWYIDGLQMSIGDHESAQVWARIFATRATQHLGMFCFVYPLHHDDVVVHRI